MTEGDSGSTHSAAGLWSRRRFLAGSAAGGILLAATPLALRAATFQARETMPTAPGWAAEKGVGQPRYRIDGFAKVTGAKLYARDFRAADMPGWPQATGHALLLFAPEADRIFTGIDLSVLGKDLQPDRVVTADDLAQAGIAATGFFACDLFCPKGKTPAYLGQPVAMLIWHDIARFAPARQALRGVHGVVTFGAQTGPVEGAPYGANRFTRVGGDSPRGPDLYSPVKDGWVQPVRYQKAQMPVWAPEQQDGDAADRASFYGDAMRKDLTDGKAGRVFELEFQTQSIDQVFMEPECGLAWHDTANRRLAAVFDVQSPEVTLQSIGAMLAKAKAPYDIGMVDGHFAYIGGGFGGKDHTIVPLYVALAGLFGAGRPVRLALDRFEQFQFGLKRHAFRVTTRLGVDPGTGAFLVQATDLVADGGGLANFSASVADVAATAATSIYYLPRSDITTVAQHSRAVTAGSMRGYGTLQSMTAMEVLVDQVATGLQIDPIELRRRNALRTGQLNLTGNTAAGALRTVEVLDRLAAAKLWTGRADAKARFEGQHSATSFGTGIACVMKDFGAGGDGVLASVSIDRQGRITVAGNTIEMGTGISTAMAVRVAEHLGRSADISRTDDPSLWEALKLNTSDSPWTISQAAQDAAAANPRWVPLVSSPASASIGAHVNTHAAAQAALAVLRFGLWPAALAIWSEGPLGGQAAGEYITFDELRWVDGALAGAGMEPLPLPRLAAKAHEMGLVTGAMVHAFSRWSWAVAEFPMKGASGAAESWRAPIDALAVQRGSDAWQLLDRTKVEFPPASFENIGVNYYSACGTIVALSVDRTDGAVTLHGIHQVLECGRPIVPDLVSGIAQGGIAMGVGQALHEYLPLYEDGPGNGSWNLNRYRVPMAADLPLWNTVLEVLPPLSDTDPPKGMAEVVMNPVIPAILNALHDAVGKRFTKLPVTADDIMEALRR